MGKPARYARFTFGFVFLSRYAYEGKVEFQCEVPVAVTYAVQVKGGAKSVYHDDTVEVRITLHYGKKVFEIDAHNEPRPLSHELGSRSFIKNHCLSHYYAITTSSTIGILWKIIFLQYSTGSMGLSH